MCTAFKCLKRWVNWFVVVVALSAAFAIYCCLLLVFALFQVAIREPLDLHHIHKVFLALGFLFIACGLVGISLKWDGEWYIVYLSLMATGPFLQLGAVVALTLLCSFVFQRFFRAKRTASKTVIMIAFVVMTATVFLCPLFIKSPCLLEMLPAKPALIGHRGAPMLAPENTMMSFNRSAECGVVTFETDVLISKDGVPFLMHDKSLQRTTNVLQRFSERADNESSSFTWTELQELNAGKWFLQRNPYQTVSSLSEREQETAGNQSIPSLADLLKLAKDINVSIIFDMKDERNDSNDILYVVRTINDSGIPHQQVLWLPPFHRAWVPWDFQQVYSNVSEMERNGGSFLNVKYNALPLENITDLGKRNVTVNLWVVNEPWLFSLLWCAGAGSVTTNACHNFQKMEQPVWHMTPSTYRIIWISVDVASLVIMLIVFYLQRRTRERIFCPGEKSAPLL
ncbi:glycerophosphoinositol inositolphosphodiesterase GDPD2 [Arapaima gigas]